MAIPEFGRIMPAISSIENDGGVGEGWSVPEKI